MFTNPKQLIKRSGKKGIDRADYLKELVDEFQNTQNKGKNNIQLKSTVILPLYRSGVSKLASLRAIQASYYHSVFVYPTYHINNNNDKLLAVIGWIDYIGGLDLACGL